MNTRRKDESWLIVLILALEERIRDKGASRRPILIHSVDVAITVVVVDKGLGEFNPISVRVDT